MEWRERRTKGLDAVNTSPAREAKEDYDAKYRREVLNIHSEVTRCRIRDVMLAWISNATKSTLRTTLLTSGTKSSTSDIFIQTDSRKGQLRTRHGDWTVATTTLPGEKSNDLDKWIMDVSSMFVG